MKKIYVTSSILIAALVCVMPFITNAAIVQTLDIGAQNSDVTELQTFLATDATLYPEGLITGYYGPLTAAAVQRFQCREGIVCSGTAQTTGYGRVGPQTRAALNVAMGSSLPSGTDLSAPIMSDDVVTTTRNSATITWTTNENARGRVMYSTVWPFLYATAPSVSDANLDAAQNVTIAGLQPNTQYYYVRESVDLRGNVQWTIAHTFTTQP